jgi:hypothetical protein
LSTDEDPESSDRRRTPSNPVVQIPGRQGKVFASRVKGPKVKLGLLLPRFRKADERSGRYRHGEGLGRPELLWNRRAVRFQSSDVDRDRLSRAFTTVVDGSALGETSWERGPQDRVSPRFLRREHACVSPHKFILSLRRAELVRGDAG